MSWPLAGGIVVLAMALDWLQNLGQIALGAGAGLLGASLQRRWSRADAREAAEVAARHEEQRRRAERAEAVGEALLGVLDEIRSACKGCYTHGDYPSAEAIEPPLAVLNRESYKLVDKTVRERMFGIANIIDRGSALDEWGGVTPSQASYKLCGIGRETLAAMLAGEPLPDDGGLIHEYLSIIAARDSTYHQQR